MKINIMLALFLMMGFTCFSQRITIPLNYYGVWNRGGIENVCYDIDADYILGTEAGTAWDEVQPDGSGKFDFSLYQEAMEYAYRTGRILKVSIGVGPESPAWIYGHGVPLVKCSEHNPPKPQFPDFPYYLDKDYKKYYFELIRKFAQFLRNQPEHLRKTISFVQVKTGCTGDECPYKGVPLESEYIITEEEWRDFRLEAFDVFKKAFNDKDENNTSPITLLFNAVDPVKNPVENAWLNTNIDQGIGYGIKGSAYVRGHHLTGEKSFKDTWLPYLLDPQGMALFSAAEMDQTWKKPLYNINTELGFYWGALSGLNTGLSSWNVTTSALEYAEEHPEIQEIFRFFNKYAGQVYPSTATAAYIVFHEGLDAADTDKFPESEYGKADVKNVDRYLAICNDSIYKSRGARMDDPHGATLGQVRQRDSQTGYNDAGWDIESGNYSRWIEQIAPESTSVAIFRVRGPVDRKSSKYDRFARRFETETRKDTMYFRFNEKMFVSDDPKSLRFKIIWLDKMPGSKWGFSYMGKDGKPVSAISVTGVGDDQWKTVEVPVITDMTVGGTGPRDSDFMLINKDGLDDIFHGIEVDIER